MMKLPRCIALYYKKYGRIDQHLKWIEISSKIKYNDRSDSYPFESQANSQYEYAQALFERGQ
jgi:hypothetical protein